MKSIKINKHTSEEEIKKKIAENITGLGCEQNNIFGFCVFTYHKNQEYSKWIMLLSDDLCKIKKVIVDDNFCHNVDEIIDMIKQIQNTIKDDKNIKINLKKY